jgi:hypothetical protein
MLSVGIFSAAHIKTRYLCGETKDVEAGMESMTQGQLLAKHVKWAKIIGVEAICTALHSAGISKSEVSSLVV